MVSRLWTRKMTTPPPRFGEKGTRWVSYTDELPYQHRGNVTSTLYVWTSKHPRLLVDLRDLPTLVKDAGRQSLEGLQQEEQERSGGEHESDRDDMKEVENGDDNDTDG